MLCLAREELRARCTWETLRYNTTGVCMNVWFGTGENAHLSNLAPRPFADLEGRRYVSVEHAYQTWKSGRFEADAYARGKRGGKHPGRKGTRTSGGWNIKLMERLIRRSFEANPVAAEALRRTGDEPLTHTQDRGIWRTEFPRILMMVRAELRA